LVLVPVLFLFGIGPCTSKDFGFGPSVSLS